MCHRVNCSKCGKPTWSGCGMHVEEALRGVPKEKRCRCREEAAAAKAQRGESGTSWWSKLFSN